MKDLTNMDTTLMTTSRHYSYINTDANNNNMDPKSPDAKRRLISSIEFTVNEKTQGVQSKRSSRHKRSGQLTYCSTLWEVFR